MGIVQRQSIKYTFISILGSLIGALSVLYIYPLSIKSYGFSQTILSYVLILVPFLGLGASTITIRFYEPNSKNPNDILIITTIVYLISSLLIGGLLYFLL